jgi:uncharacterized protein DUF4012
MASRGRSRGRSRRPRGLRDRLLEIRDDPRRLALSIAGVVVVLAGLLFAWEAYRAVGALQDANERAELLKQNIVDGNVDAARRSLMRLDESTSRAHHSTDGPVWWLAAHVPILGRNADAVSTVSRDLDQVSDDVLPGIVDVADKVRLETFRPKDGRVDLEAVAAAAPVLVKADDVFAEADRSLGDFDVNGLVPLLRRPMTALQTRFHRTAVAAAAANDAAKLLPTMLGGDGRKRTFLLLILNNAEVRSLAGMPGSIAVITAKDGKIKMGKQGGIQDVLPVKKPPIKLTKQEKRVFQSSVATDMRDTAIVPDFPRAAELAAAVVGRRWKEKYDGVIGVDPIALGYMLEGLGPVDVGDNLTINSSNAVGTLLNLVYLKYPKSPNKQDDVFENAARRIFDATVDGTGDSVAVIRSLVRGVSERRVMLWSRDPREQKRIQSSGISGALDQGSGRPQVGVFVNDNGSTKMEFYLGMSTSLRSERCLASGAQEIRTTTTLVSNAPPNAYRLPQSIVGYSQWARPGNMKLGVMIFGPHGGEITSMTVDGHRAPIGGTKLAGRPITKVARELPPGQNSIIVTTMRTAVASTGDPELRTTPGVVPNDDRAEPSACG